MTKWSLNQERLDLHQKINDHKWEWSWRAKNDNEMKSSTRKKTPFLGEKMNWSDNIIFFWKSFLTQIVYLNKTKLSFHFEYFFPTSRLQAKFLWKNREEKKKNCSIHGLTVFLRYILSVEVTYFFFSLKSLNLEGKGNILTTPFD